jgi:hypothetical protein
MKSLFDTLNIVYGEDEKRGCWAAPNSTPREHQTARDTTTGSPKPMGACGHD